MSNLFGFKQDFVYFIVSGFSNYVKIGVTSRPIGARIKDMQTGNPDVLRLMGFIVCDDRKHALKIEKEVQLSCDLKHHRNEWFQLDSKDILSVLGHYHGCGYIALSGNSKQLVGVDEEGIPEYASLWDWDELNWLDCCPDCGLVNGVVKDKYQGYLCSCGYQPDNDPDLGPDIDIPWEIE